MNKINNSTKHEWGMGQQNTLLFALKSIACIAHVVRVPQGRGVNDAAVFAYSKSFDNHALAWLPCYGDAEGEKRQSLKRDVELQQLRTDFLILFVITRLLLISYSCFDVFHEQYRINRTKHVVFAKNLLPDFSISIPKAGHYEKLKSSVFRTFSQICETFAENPGTGTMNSIIMRPQTRKASLHRLYLVSLVSVEEQFASVNEERTTQNVLRAALSSRTFRDRMLLLGNILAHIGVEYLRLPEQRRTAKVLTRS